MLFFDLESDVTNVPDTLVETGAGGPRFEADGRPATLREDGDTILCRAVEDEDAAPDLDDGL